MADKEEIVRPWDLSEGTIPQSTHALMSLEIDGLRQRLVHQQSAFMIGAGFVLVLALSFLCFSFRIVWLLENDKTFDWHVLLLGSGLIVPATLILYALIKHSHRPHANSAPSASGEESDLEKLPNLVLRLAGKE